MKILFILEISLRLRRNYNTLNAFCIIDIRSVIETSFDTIMFAYTRSGVTIDPNSIPISNCLYIITPLVCNII